MSITFVTSFFNLKRAEPEIQRERGLEEYIKHGNWLLQQDISLYIFTEPEYVNLFLAKRRALGFEDKTVVKGLEIKNLPYYYRLGRVKLAREINPMRNANPNKDTPLYTLLTWCKFDFVFTVIKENPFISTHFGWIDFGIKHVANTDFIERDQTFTIKDGPIRLLTLRIPYASDKLNNSVIRSGHQNHIEYQSLMEHFFAYERGLVAAGFITGYVEYWKKFIQLFREELDICLKLLYAPSEQQLIPILMKKHPALFSTYVGDYESILSNYKFFRRNLFNINNYTLHPVIQKLSMDTSSPSEERKEIEDERKTAEIVANYVFEQILEGNYNFE